MWVQLILWVVSTIISYMMQPKPKNAQPGKVDMPNIEEGAPITVLFGSHWIKSPTIAWWGDTRIDPIYSKGGKK